MKSKLLAAVTASGAILCLTVSADSRDEPTDRASTLSLRVEQLREKLRSSSFSSFSDSDDDIAKEKIENIVQFFNFFNCFRPGWRNC